MIYALIAILVFFLGLILGWYFRSTRDRDELKRLRGVICGCQCREREYRKRIAGLTGVHYFDVE